MKKRNNLIDKVCATLIRYLFPIVLLLCVPTVFAIVVWLLSHATGSKPSTTVFSSLLLIFVALYLPVFLFFYVREIRNFAMQQKGPSPSKPKTWNDVIHPPLHKQSGNQKSPEPSRGACDEIVVVLRKGVEF